MTRDHPDWRPIMAALANPRTRRVFAGVELGQDADALAAAMTPAQRDQALAVLLKSGVIVEAGGRYAVRSDVFARALEASPRPPKKTGVARYLDAEGRIDRYPSSNAELEALLEHVAESVLTPDEVVSEAELGARLEPFDPDVARLRRALIDHGVLERTRSGSEYARARE